MESLRETLHGDWIFMRQLLQKFYGIMCSRLTWLASGIWATNRYNSCRWDYRLGLSQILLKYLSRWCHRLLLSHYNALLLHVSQSISNNTSPLTHLFCDTRWGDAGKNVKMRNIVSIVISLVSPFSTAQPVRNGHTYSRLRSITFLLRQHIYFFDLFLWTIYRSLASSTNNHRLRVDSTPSPVTSMETRWAPRCRLFTIFYRLGRRVTTPTTIEVQQ